jgi:hypothetical protein
LNGWMGLGTSVLGPVLGVVIGTNLYGLLFTPAGAMAAATTTAAPARTTRAKATTRKRTTTTRRKR